VKSQIKKTIGIIGRARGFMNGPQLLLLYNTMVLPYLQYCLLNWGNFEVDGNLGFSGELLTLQKSLVRIIGESNDPISHADPLFAKFSILKIEDLFSQKVGMFSFKLSRGLLPSGMAALVVHTRSSFKVRISLVRSCGYISIFIIFCQEKKYCFRCPGRQLFGAIPL